MDSLDLPQDMFWSSKSEPMSPGYKCLVASGSSSSLFLGAPVDGDAEQDSLWPEEDIFSSYFDEIEEDSSATATTKTTTLTIDYDTEEGQKPRGAEEMLQELIELNEEGQWLNQENVDLSLMTAATVSPPDCNNRVVADSFDNAATELIFNEITNFCKDFEAAGYQHLTPPQSPPTSPPLFAATIDNNNHGIHQPQQQLQSPMHAESMNFGSFVDLQLQSNVCLDKTFVKPEPEPQQAQIDADLVALELIDELLRNKTKDVHENYVLINTQQQQQSLTRNDSLLDYCDDNATQYPSYGNSLASSPSRSSTSSRSSSGCGDDSQDDDEWMPESSVDGGLKKAQKRSSSTSAKASPAKRRPYERGGGEQEKKSRKKEQNKNAATRYRQKKKQEVETILEQETRLQKTNRKLTAQFNEARKEMKYLRNLLRDMYRNNGIIV